MNTRSQANYDWGRWDSEHGNAARKEGWTIRWIEDFDAFMLWTSQPAPEMHYLKGNNEVWNHVLHGHSRPHCRAALEFIAEHNAPTFMANVCLDAWPQRQAEWLKVLAVTAALRA